MKKIIIITAALAAMVSCQSLKEEFQPVFTTSYDQPQPSKIWTQDEVVKKYGEIISIADLVSQYEQGKPFDMTKKNVISGIISTTDQPGNFYKSFYIQDETGGIEIKVGKTGLYNDFLPGQRVYVNLKGLTLGMYGFKSNKGNGMVQIGGSRNLNNDGTPADKYETSYIENAVVIDSHILRGEVEGGKAQVPAAEEISVSDLPGTSATQATNPNVGRLVTLKGLKYDNQVFVLLYLDSNRDKESYDNRVFLSDTQWGVTTWAMSENKMKSYLYTGIWDTAEIGSGATRLKYICGTTKTVADLAHVYFFDPVIAEPYIKAGTYALDENRLPYYTDGDRKVYFMSEETEKIARAEMAKNNYFLDPDNVPYMLTKDIYGHTLYPGIEKAAYSVSQYFKMGNRNIQVRTSGYCKFSDTEINPAVLDGSKTISVTGILTLYEGSIQITVNDVTDFVVE